ncbi:MAG: winged helix-turn-helix domain-containing protein [Bacilli bacterium]
MNLNSNKKNMLYQEIALEYKKYIKLKVFNYGDKLPSVRQIATEFGINPNTVNKSFQVLEEEGYIKIYPKKGAFVIYEDKNDNMDQYLNNQILALKNSGVSKEKLEQIIIRVYGGDK